MVMVSSTSRSYAVVGIIQKVDMAFGCTLAEDIKHHRHGFVAMANRQNLVIKVPKTLGINWQL